MPVTTIQNVRNTSGSIRYLFYGTASQKKIEAGEAKFNEAHDNPNGIKHRNQLVSAVDMPATYHGALKTFDYYNHEQSRCINKGIMVVLSFGKDFDFHNKEDVYQAMTYARQYVKTAFPNHSALLCAQCDGGHQGYPIPHIHCLISRFDENSMKTMTNSQTNIYRMRTIADNIACNYNINQSMYDNTFNNMHLPYKKRHLDIMKPYQHQGSATPSAEELVVLRPLRQVMSEHPFSQTDFRRKCRHYGLQAKFIRHRGKQSKHAWHQRGLVLKAKGSDGYIKASQLRHFDRWCPNVSQLHNRTSRTKLFHANKPTHDRINKARRNFQQSYDALDSKGRRALYADTTALQPVKATGGSDASSSSSSGGGSFHFFGSTEKAINSELNLSPSECQAQRRAMKSMMIFLQLIEAFDRWLDRLKRKQKAKAMSFGEPPATAHELLAIRKHRLNKQAVGVYKDCLRDNKGRYNQFASPYQRGEAQLTLRSWWHQHGYAWQPPIEHSHHSLAYFALKQDERRKHQKETPDFN